MKAIVKKIPRMLTPYHNSSSEQTAGCSATADYVRNIRGLIRFTKLTIQRNMQLKIGFIVCLSVFKFHFYFLFFGKLMENMQRELLC